MGFSNNAHPKLIGKIMVKLLTETEITENLKNLANWSLSGKTIESKLTFADFIAAIDFVNKLVEPAETAGHHPDLAISYNRVTITLTTHDAGGLTEKDFNLAKVIDQLS
jgi:4a-hydroxytetrahydrobiopterin dehydratase